MREKNLILVVDDSPTVLHGTCRILQKAGYETIEASSGMDGLRLTIEHKPALVLLDVVLPDIYGYEVCQRIKEEANLTGTIVILISSLDTHEDHQAQGLEFGADGYITRPVSNRNLLAHIKSFLRLKAAEDNLRQSELKFRTVADFTYDWEYWIAPDGGILYMSPSSERITGYRRDEFVNNPELLVEIIHKDDMRNATDHLNHIELSGAHIVDFRIITRNGEERWIAHQCQPIFDDGGKLLGRRVSNRDITERKFVEEELRASDARFRSYFESPMVGVAITSLDKGWLEVNQALCAMLGYSRQELSGMTWAQLTHPDDLDADVAQFSRVIAGEIDTYAMEKRFIRKNGDVIWTILSVSCVRKLDGVVDYYVALLQDITERKRVEVALRDSEERFRILFETAADGILLLDAEGENRGKIVSANPAAAVMSGYTVDELLALEISDLDTAESGRKVPERYEKLLRGEILRDEVIHRRKDGSIFPLEICCRSFDQVDHQYIVALHRDITDRKLMEEDKENVIVELQKALSEVKQLKLFLPICASCKKIRDDEGYWSEIERYIGEHTDTQFSHGICPDCMRKLYPEYADEVLGRVEKDEKK